MCKQNHFSRTTNNNYYRVHNLRCRRIHTLIIYNNILHTHINVIQYYFIFSGLASGF